MVGAIVMAVGMKVVGTVMLMVADGVVEFVLMVRLATFLMAPSDDVGMAVSEIVVDAMGTALAVAAVDKVRSNGNTGTIPVVDAVDDAAITLVVVAQRCRSGNS